MTVNITKLAEIINQGSF